MVIGNSDVGDAVSIKIADRDAGVRPAHGIGDLILESAVTVVHKYADGWVAVIGDQDIRLAVHVHVANGGEFRLQTRFIDLLRAERSVAPSEQQAQRIPVAV